MNKSNNIEFLIVLIVALIIIYITFSFIEFNFNVGDWTVICRIFAVLSFFGISGFMAKNIYK